MKLFIVCLFLFSGAYAGEDIELKIDWVQNVAKSTVLEVCGKAVSKTGKWPLLVSITHGESVFSTMTSKDNRFCQLLGRQTWDGKVTAEASTLDQGEVSKRVTIIK